MLIFSPCAFYRVQFDFQAKNFSGFAESFLAYNGWDIYNIYTYTICFTDISSSRYRKFSSKIITSNIILPNSNVHCNNNTASGMCVLQLNIFYCFSRNKTHGNIHCHQAFLAALAFLFSLSWIATLFNEGYIKITLYFNSKRYVVCGWTFVFHEFMSALL